MAINRTAYIHTRLVAAIALSLSLGACLDDNSACIEDRPGYQEGNDLWMSFRIENAASLSRSRATVPTDPANHPGENASADEKYIDTKDIAVIFFDDNQHAWKFFTGDDIWLDEVGNDKTTYKLTFKINKDYFAYATESQVDYSLMVVTNLEGLGGDHGTFGDDLFAMTPAEIADRYTSFEMPDQSKPWTPGGTPDGNTKRIPMAGISKSSFPVEYLDDALAAGNSLSNPYEIDDIYIQRCLAKIRVLTSKELSDKDGRVTNVTLTGSNTRGAYIPVDASNGWYDGTTELETATEQSGWYNADRTVAFSETSHTVDGNVLEGWVCYVPESDVIGRETKLNITVTFTNEDKTTEVKEYTVKLKDPIGDTSKGINAIARNHIYEYIVDADRAEGITLKYTVCPMDIVNIDIPAYD